MKHKILLSILFASFALLPLSARQRGTDAPKDSVPQRISVLGDSYSTYGGYVSPSTNLCWYNGTDGGTNKQNDVSRVEETWWHLLTSLPEYRLEVNNSYSGSTVCHTGYKGADYSDRAFITRVHHLGHPDIILVFGGTNDSWAGSPIGSYRHFGWSRTELFAFRPAFCYLLHQLRELYPTARIYNITNSELSDDITNSMEEICRHYGVPNIRLHDIDKQWGHPSVKGMRSIFEQVRERLEEK